MDITNILYYSRDTEACKNETISLRKLSLRDEFDLEIIFNSAKEAIDSRDLMERLQRVIWEEIEFDQETTDYVRFKVYDYNHKLNYLKFKKAKEHKDDRT